MLLTSEAGSQFVRTTEISRKRVVTEAASDGDGHTDYCPAMVDSLREDPTRHLLRTKIRRHMTTFHITSNLLSHFEMNYQQ